MFLIKVVISLLLGIYQHFFKILILCVLGILNSVVLEFQITFTKFLIFKCVKCF